jgi:hypothetical protein
LTTLTGAAPAQDAKPAAPQSRQRPSQEELAAKREDKLAKPFLKNANWFTDYDKAREEAQRTGKLIFVYFTRTYAR